MDINTNIDVTKKFDNGLVAICKSKTTVTLNNPAYVGMCILDLSKSINVWIFHYDYIKNRHGNKSWLLFTSTNSLMYEVKTGDVYEDFSKDKKSLILVSI